MVLPVNPTSWLNHKLHEFDNNYLQIFARQQLRGTRAVGDVDKLTAVQGCNKLEPER